MKINLKKFQPVLVSLVFMFGSALVVGWMWYGVIGLGETLLDRMQIIANENAFDSQYRSLTTIMEDTEEDRLALEGFILRDESDTIALLSKFDEIAVDQNVELTTNKLQVEETANSFNNLFIDYRISGKEKEVTKIIKMFETLPYHGDITSLNINRVVNQDTKAVNLEVTLSLLLSIKKYD